MAFRFRLDSVLRYRENLERIEELRLTQIRQELVALHERISGIEQNRQTLHEQRDRDLAEGLPAAHLSEFAEQDAQLRAAADNLLLQVCELERKRAEQMEVYRRARQDREVLSEIRKQQRQAYTQEQQRRDQKTLDELFLARAKEGT